MLNRPTTDALPSADVPRDERSMRLMEYALALISFGAALLLAAIR